MGIAGQKILVTRLPQHSQSLIDAIQAQHGIAVCQPLYAVEPLLHADLGLMQRASQSDLGVFVSRNAVAIVMPLLDSKLPWIWAAVGAGTAKELLNYGVPQVLYPQGASNSRRLFSKLLAAKLERQHRTALIFAGADGNPWLAQNLQRLGMEVEVVATYRRIMPTDFGLPSDLDLIIITCVTSLVNLQKLAPTLNVPLLVISDRIKRIALEMGYSTVYNSNGTADEEILTALTQVNYAE